MKQNKIHTQSKNFTSNADDVYRLFSKLLIGRKTWKIDRDHHILLDSPLMQNQVRCNILDMDHNLQYVEDLASMLFHCDLNRAASSLQDSL